MRSSPVVVAGIVDSAGARVPGDMAGPVVVILAPALCMVVAVVVRAGVLVYQIVLLRAGCADD